MSVHVVVVVHVQHERIGQQGVRRADTCYPGCRKLSEYGKHLAQSL